MQPDQMDPRTAAAVTAAVQKLDEQWQRKLVMMKGDLELRKWCVMQASVGIAGSAVKPDTPELAKRIYDFVTDAFAGEPPSS